MYVLVVGGGKVGYFLTQYLLQENYEVTLIEKDYARYKYLEDKLGETVFYGNGSEMSTLEKAGIQRADVVAAVTGHDEDNIIICQMAKDIFKVPKVVGRVNNPKNEDAFRLLGITHFVNSTKLIYQLIEEEVGIGKTLHLLTLKSQAEIIELIIDHNSKVLGKSLKDIILPKNTIVISVFRNNSLIIPDGNTKFEPLDSVLLLTTPDNTELLKDIFLNN